MALDIETSRKHLESILEDPVLVEKYLKAYGPTVDIKYIKQIRDASRAEKAEIDQKLETPLYRIKVKCPVCLQADIPCHELKSKSLIITNDRFMAPNYQGAPGFRNLNYTLAAVTICPRCLFASPDKKDFVTLNMLTRNEMRSQLPQGVLRSLEEKTGQRRQMLAAINPPIKIHACPRKPSAAVFSYQLSLHRAQVEAEFEVPNAWFKAGMYCLKIARLHRDMGEPDDGDLKEALRFMTLCYTRSKSSKPSVEFQAAYSVAVLSLRLGNENGFQAFVGSMEKVAAGLRTIPTEESEDQLQELERWIDKAKTIWQDRDEPDLWSR